MVARPLDAKVTVDTFVSVPAIYDILVEQVIVIALDVSLYIVIASPADQIILGIVIEPPDTTLTYLPTSLVVKV
jgi:hypothetical protein